MFTKINQTIGIYIYIYQSYIDLPAHDKRSMQKKLN